MNGKTFCTVFPGYKDYHFFKDPGQLPYRFSKLGYDSVIVCYGRGRSFPETEKYLRVKALPDGWLARRLNASVILYLLANAKKIDILNVFHLAWPALLFVYIYKTLNRRGFAYLKLDNCVFSGTYPWEEDYSPDSGERRGRVSVRRRIKSCLARRFFLGKIDLWSVEDEYSREQYEERHEFLRGRIMTVTNGHTSDLPGSASAGSLEEKEEMILTAGRLGTHQKATEVLLEAFRLAAPGNSYTLHLAGPVEPAIESYAESFLDQNPELRDRVIFHGPLGRDELYSLYNRSQIFCMSSRYEGMAIVFPEAMYYRNAIVTTNPVSLKYFIDRYGAGITVAKDDPEALAGALTRLITDNELRGKMAEAAFKTATNLMNWNRIAGELEVEINRRRKHEGDQQHN